jgi:hypothetical protein
LKANVDAGTVRDDLNPKTLLRGLAALLYLNPKRTGGSRPPR